MGFAMLRDSTQQKHQGSKGPGAPLAWRGVGESLPLAEALDSDTHVLLSEPKTGGYRRSSVFHGSVSCWVVGYTESIRLHCIDIHSLAACLSPPIALRSMDINVQSPST